MHILGLANGTIDGNSDILLKAALQAAQKSDPSITTSWIHVPSVLIPRNPKPLPGTPDISLGGIAREGVDENSIDDRPQILEAIIQADAIVIATPVYSHQPAGFLKAMIDRLLGPFTDAALVQRIVDGKAKGDEQYMNMAVDERILKPRVVGFIAVSGSTLPDQITMALPTLHQFVYCLHAKVVDQHVFSGYANPGAVTILNGGTAIERAERLGVNVASQMGRSFDEAVFLGERQEDDCPYCHLSTVEIDHTANNDIGCLTCGARGRMVVTDGRIRLEWEQDSRISCITMKGKVKHIDDIRSAAQNEVKHAKEIQNGRERWKEVRIPAVSLPSATRGKL